MEDAFVIDFRGGFGIAAGDEEHVVHIHAPEAALDFLTVGVHDVVHVARDKEASDRTHIPAFT
ncbi:hypothetical protein SDC9_201217 [bioreactor metagenome]|uniref:Uncharacterized protein n=1 Tax=bioreactor metagenome TaxID=1076179 RepID=A0A645J283_9ZZZZ